MSTPIPAPTLQEIELLTNNQISWQDLKHFANTVTAADLQCIVEKIFDTDQVKLLQETKVTGFTDFVNRLKNKQRSARYEYKMNTRGVDFRKPGGNNYVVVAEGDSWFNYPLLLSDVLDWTAMEPNIALLSIANGADWLLNMLCRRKYVDGITLHNPDFFLLSGGGNDIVGLQRVAVIVNTNQVDISSPESEFQQNEWVRLKLMKRYLNGNTDGVLPLTKIGFKKEQFLIGASYLNREFYSLLMLFKLQYHFIIQSLVIGQLSTVDKPFKPTRFPHLKVITQGYDYVVPDSSSGLGFNIFKWYKPLLRLAGHGGWLQTPLNIKGVPAKDQLDVMYAMIFLFNEMIMDVAQYFNDESKMLKNGDRVFYIDNRGTVPNDGWTDELHPQPEYFKKVAKRFIKCINGKLPTDANSKDASRYIYTIND